VVQILIPIDAKPHSQLSVDLAVTLFKLSGARITLLHVVADPDTAMLLADKTGQVESRYSQTSKEEVTDLLESVSKPLSNHGADVSVRIEQGHPTTILRSIMESEQFAVTIAAPGQHTARERMLTGSVSAALTRTDFEGALVVARKTSSRDSAQPVVFALDGSAESIAALLLFAPIIHDRLPLALITSHSEKNLLGDAIETLDRSKRTYHSIKSDEKPETSVPKYLAQNQVSLLVLARTRDDVLHRPLTGPLSERLFLQAPCSAALYCSRSKL